MDYTGYGDAPNDDLSLRQAWANMLRGLSNKQSWQDLGQGIQNTAQVLPNVAESLARGGAAQAVGTFGDLRDLKNTIQSYLPQGVQNWQAGVETLANPMAKALVQRSPTTEQVLEAVPRATAPYEGYKQHEFIGQFVAPPATGLVSDVLKLGKNLPVGASIKAVDELPVPKVTKDELGFYSTLDDAVNNLKQEKGTNAQFLAQLLKSPAVKQEEITVRGLDKFLENNPKLTKQEIQDYLLHNKSKLGETVLDENHYAKGTYEDYRLRDAEAIDDQDYINSYADDLSYEYKNDPNMVEEARVKLLEKDPEHYADWETNPSIAERLQKDVEQELDNMAYDNASTSYWDDPIYRHEDEFGFEVLGNDNMGYSIKDPNGKWLNKSFNDLSDAEHYLRDHHLEQDNLRFEEQGPKYADYQLGGPKENYREVLIQYEPKKEPARPVFSVQADAMSKSFDTMAEAEAYKSELQKQYPNADIPITQTNLTANPRYSQTPDFHSSHFDEPNIVAHMRVNDRVIDGKKTLFIEEIQSDWHQAGRKKGYLTSDPVKELDEYEKNLPTRTREAMKKNALKDGLSEKEADDLSTSIVRNTDFNGMVKYLGEVDKYTELFKKARNKDELVPDAPYKKNWQELAMRRAIQMAAEGGYDRVAFTTGAQQADRYSLSKQINDLKAEKIRGGTKDGQYEISATDKNGRPAIYKVVAENELEDLIGKDLAKKIVEDAPQYPDGKTYSGLDLEVGGQGMKGFYDKILPDYVNKYGKKYGIKVGKTQITTGKTRDASGIPSMYDQKEEVHYFDLTPEAKSSLLEKGSPLFAAPAIGLTGEESRREILEKLMGK